MRRVRAVIIKLTISDILITTTNRYLHTDVYKQNYRMTASIA